MRNFSPTPESIINIKNINTIHVNYHKTLKFAQKAHVDIYSRSGNDCTKQKIRENNIN